MLSTSMKLIPSKLSAAPEEHFCASTSEEHSEYIIGVKLIFSKMLMISLWEVLFIAVLIIDLTFFSVTKACKSSTNLLEGVCCVWGTIFIWMESES
jgi:hypothetical protein